MCWFAALGTAMGASAATATATGVAATMSIASTAMSVYSAVSGAKGEQGQAKYNAAVARNNALSAEYQAQDAISRGNKAAEDHSRKVAALSGTQRASMAARGLDLSEGTPVDILTDTELFGTYDTNTIKDNAAKEAWGARSAASNYRGQAGQYDTQANNISPMMAAGGSLMSGAASIADKWYRTKG
jgi:hypothetical protein